MLTEQAAPGTSRIHRTQILRYASRLTTHPDIPEAVTANAQILQAWLEAAADIDDQRDRVAALQYADSNRADDRSPDDDPHRLISEADAYHAFLRAGLPQTGEPPTLTPVATIHPSHGKDA